MKKTLIALTLTSLLAGCSLDGKDGKDGAQGETGAVGEAGQNGNNASQGFAISLIGRAVLNAESPEGAAEIVAYHNATKRIFAINSSGEQAVVNIIAAEQFDASALTPNEEGVVTGTNLTTAQELALNTHTTGDANSIAINEQHNLLAVAMANETGVKGQIAFYDISADTPSFIRNVEVGYLPDMVAFTPDGSKVVVANEGEPKGDYSIDPEGSIAVIDITNGQPATSATLIGFTAFNDKQAQLEADGVVFANPAGRTIIAQQARRY